MISPDYPGLCSTLYDSCFITIDIYSCGDYSMVFVLDQGDQLYKLSEA